MADVNECLQNPCSNSVTCQNVPGSYTCVCNSGWTGQDCDIGKSIANSVIWLTQVHEFFGIVRLQYWVQLNYFTIKSTYNVSFIINLCYKYGLTFFFYQISTNVCGTLAKISVHAPTLPDPIHAHAHRSGQDKIATLVKYS